MVYTYVVLGFSNTSTNLTTLFQLANGQTALKLWERVVGSTPSRICCKHFKQDDLDSDYSRGCKKKTTQGRSNPNIAIFLLTMVILKSIFLIIRWVLS